MTTPKEDPSALFEQFGGLFAEIFGMTDTGSSDLGMPLELTLADLEGVEREIEVPRRIACAACAGRGAPEGTASTPCSSCDGKGQLTEAQGMFGVSRTCSSCRGRGEIFEVKCGSCIGLGGVTRPEKLVVKVPPGVANGQSLRLEGKGNETADGCGDLFINIAVATDDRLGRNGDDLIARVEISIELAETGGKVLAPLPDGEIEVAVPANTETGTELRLRGFGTLKLGSPPCPRPTGKEEPYRSIDTSMHRGDLIVRLVLEGESDPLGVLGLSSAASPEDIEKAYRMRALEYHPGRNNRPNAERRSAELDAAYAALTGAPMAARERAGIPVVLWWAALALVALAVFVVSLT